MGCGMTKLSREDASGPMYLYYNPMHRNMEEFPPSPGPTKKNDDQDTTKRSLPENVGGHAVDNIHNHHKGHNKACLPRMSNVESDCMVMKQAPVQQTMQVKAVDEPNNLGGDLRNLDIKSADEEKTKDKVIDKESNRNDEDENHGSIEKDDMDDSDGNNNNNNNNNGVRVNGEASIFYPGSPSFREYCVVSSADSDDSCKDEGVDEVKREKALQNRNDVDFTATEPLKLQSNPSPKKGQASRRRFRGVLSRTGRGGMKNLLQVAACNPHRSFSGNRVT